MGCENTLKKEALSRVGSGTLPWKRAARTESKSTYRRAIKSRMQFEDSPGKALKMLWMNEINVGCLAQLVEQRPYTA